MNFSAGKTGLGDIEARLLKCDDESVQGEQDWVLHGDSRPISICNKFVPGRLCYVNKFFICIRRSKDSIWRVWG